MEEGQQVFDNYVVALMNLLPFEYRRVPHEDEMIKVACSGLNLPLRRPELVLRFAQDDAARVLEHPDVTCVAIEWRITPAFLGNGTCGVEFSVFVK